MCVCVCVCVECLIICTMKFFFYYQPLLGKEYVCLLVYSFVSADSYFIHPTPPSRAGRDTRSIFKWSSTHLNSEFFIS